MLALICPLPFSQTWGRSNGKGSNQSTRPHQLELTIWEPIFWTALAKWLTSLFELRLTWPSHMSKLACECNLASLVRGGVQACDWHLVDITGTKFQTGISVHHSVSVTLDTRNRSRISVHLLCFEMAEYCMDKLKSYIKYLKEYRVYKMQVQKTPIKQEITHVQYNEYWWISQMTVLKFFPIASLRITIQNLTQSLKILKHFVARDPVKPVNCISLSHRPPQYRLI